MITTVKKRSKKVLPEKLGGKKLTLPNMSVNVRQALGMYRDKSMEEKMGAYYEEAGQPIPNFEMMDKIERLEALNEWRNKTIEKQDKLNSLNDQAKKAYDEMVINNKIKLKADELVQQQQRTANTGNQTGN